MYCITGRYMAARKGARVKTKKPTKKAAKISHGQREFNRLASKYSKWVLRQYPGLATYMGIHEYDQRLTNYAPKALAERRDYIAKYLKEFRAIPARDLDLDSKIERQLIIDNLHARTILDRKWPLEERDPGLYLVEGVYSCYTITIRECGDAEEAAQKMTERLLLFPKMINQGRRLATKPTRINCQVAMMAGAGAIGFFKDTVAKFAKRVKAARTRQAMRDAAQLAEEAVLEYLSWIEIDLMPTASDDFAYGQDLFEMLLKKTHQIDMKADDLLKLGKQAYRQTISELEATAAKLDKRFTWEQQIEILKRDHPTNNELVHFYGDEMKRAKRFVIERRLVDIPEGERIDVVPTPEFARPIIPYAAYIGPAPFEQEQRGIFWVSLVDRNKSPEEMMEQLRGHCTHGIVVTALHEAYPGHHLQLTVANRLHKRPLRVHLNTSVFCEGWALYCEQMMWEQGFYDDIRSRMLQLKDQLWRACRVIIDVNLHVGGWSPEKAVQFLVEKAKLELPNAEAEVRRYCQTPTQPMSYIVGKKQVLEILADYKTKRGDAFNLRQFHNELIRHGSLPAKQIRMLMGLPKG